MGVNRLKKEVESEYSVLEDSSYVGLIGKSDFGVYSKMAEKRIFLIFVDSELNLCKASQVRAFSPRAHASFHRSL